MACPPATTTPARPARPELPSVARAPTVAPALPGSRTSPTHRPVHRVLLNLAFRNTRRRLPRFCSSNSKCRRNSCASPRTPRRKPLLNSSTRRSSRSRSCRRRSRRTTRRRRRRCKRATSGNASRTTAAGGRRTSTKSRRRERTSRRIASVNDHRSERYVLPLSRIYLRRRRVLA